MADLALTSDWDLAFIDGDLAEVAGGDLTRQNSKFRLQIIAGELFEDNRSGVPWLTDMVDPRVSIDAKKAILRQNIVASFGCISVDSLSIVIDGSTAKCDFSGTCSAGQFTDSLVIYSDDDFVNPEVPEYGTEARTIALGVINDDYSTSFAMYGTVPVLVTLESLWTGTECQIVTLGNIAVYDNTGTLIVAGNGAVTMPQWMLYDDLQIYVYQPRPVPSVEVTLSFNIDPTDEDAYNYFVAVKAENPANDISPEFREMLNDVVFVPLKAGTLWGKLFDLQLYANYNLGAGRFGIKQLAAGNIYEAGFVANTGVTVTDGSTGLFEYTIDLVNPNEDFFFGIGVTGVVGNGPIVYANQTVPDDCRIAIETVTGSFEAAVQCDPADQFDCGTTLGRDTVIVRDGATSSKVYKDGVLVASDAGASVGYGANAVYLGSYDGATADITVTYLWVASGQALTDAEAAELKAIIDNYLAAL